MPKYISLDDINRYPIRRDRCDESMKDDPFICGIESVMDSVNRQPTLDIVFCKDCRYWQTDDWVEMGGAPRAPDGQKFARCEMHNYEISQEHRGWCPKENDYCSLAEREVKDYENQT